MKATYTPKGVVFPMVTDHISILELLEYYVVLVPAQQEGDFEKGDHFGSLEMLELIEEILKELK